MKIEIVKRADDGGVLRCTRRDGSIAWQKQSRHGVHFAFHDMTHYAVETTLGLQGFFALVANGWEIEETTGTGLRGAVPAETLEAERLVGLLDAERASGTVWSVEEFNTYSPRKMEHGEFERVRALRNELFERWAAVPIGASLALEFPEVTC